MEYTSSGPLTGLKVIELAGLGPGPFAGMLLADLGAEVIQIERLSGSAGQIPEGLDALRRNRSAVALDLRHPDGARAVLQMVEQADVLIEGNRPGVTERLGLGPDDCLARNPQLVYGRMTGWGQTGPLASTAGHDIGYIAITGALHAMGRDDTSPPTIPLNLLGDFAGGSLYLAFGVLAAVMEARRSGRGQVVDAAIVDGAASLTGIIHSMITADLWRDNRGVNILDGGVPWYDTYRTADSKWLAIGAIEPKFYTLLMTTLGLDADERRRTDPSEWSKLREDIARVIATRTRAEWDSVFASTDACVAPVLSLTEAHNHPHLAARGTFVDVGGVQQPAAAPRFSRTPSGTPRPPRRSGQDTRSVLTDWKVTGVEELIASGVALDRADA